VQPIAIAAAIVAAAIHAWFFALESVWFMRPAVFRRFGVKSEEEARIVRSFAYNQGFYNLFLAAGVVIGLVLCLAGDGVAGGRAIVLFACGSMVAAGVVLVTQNRAFAAAAAIQAVPPLVAIVAQLSLG
jgi:putative membrane protein